MLYTTYYLDETAIIYSIETTVIDRIVTIYDLPPVYTTRFIVRLSLNDVLAFVYLSDPNKFSLRIRIGFEHTD